VHDYVRVTMTRLLHSLICGFVWVALPSYAASFLVCGTTVTANHAFSAPALRLHNSNEEPSLPRDSDDQGIGKGIGNDEGVKGSKDDDDDDDEAQVRAYGRRSLAWTQKYRKLLPYEYARKTAMNLGLRSKDDWDEYLADGKVYHGPYLPSRPDEMYAEEWLSWEEFLGITRTYNETRQIVQQVLQLKSMEEYKAFVSADLKRAEGLRIPAKPDVYYRDKGWINEEHFFGQIEKNDAT
jgi:hypothetical protein